VVPDTVNPPPGHPPLIPQMRLSPCVVLSAFRGFPFVPRVQPYSCPLLEDYFFHPFSLRKLEVKFFPFFSHQKSRSFPVLPILFFSPSRKDHVIFCSPPPQPPFVLPGAHHFGSEISLLLPQDFLPAHPGFSPTIDRSPLYDKVWPLFLSSSSQALTPLF